MFNKKTLAVSILLSGTSAIKMAKNTESPVPACTSIGCVHDEVARKKAKKEVVYPDRPLDSDIQHSLKHMKDQESKHGAWTLPDDQNVDISSIPACTSLGCLHNMPKKGGHPVDYFVPNFGIDQDILDT